MPRARRVDILVCYDVATDTKAGRRRLRKVAIACLAFGQRVQNSVFECRISLQEWEALEARLLEIIEPTEDRLRLYRLPADYEANVRIHGLRPDFDLKSALIV